MNSIPRAFYNHVKKFNKNVSQIEDLKSNYNIDTSVSDKAEVLCY